MDATRSAGDVGAEWLLPVWPGGSPGVLQSPPSRLAWEPAPGARGPHWTSAWQAEADDGEELGTGLVHQVGHGTGAQLSTWAKVVAKR